MKHSILLLLLLCASQAHGFCFEAKSIDEYQRCMNAFSERQMQSEVDAANQAAANADAVIYGQKMSSWDSEAIEQKFDRIDDDLNNGR